MGTTQETTLKVPVLGFILPNWRLRYAYQSIASLYMEQTGESKVEHINGCFYSKEQINIASC